MYTNYFLLIYRLLLVFLPRSFLLFQFRCNCAFNWSFIFLSFFSCFQFKPTHASMRYFCWAFDNRIPLYDMSRYLYIAESVSIRAYLFLSDSFRSFLLLLFLFCARVSTSYTFFFYLLFRWRNRKNSSFFFLFWFFWLSKEKQNGKELKNGTQDDVTDFFIEQI